jgi:hypothetical protein
MVVFARSCATASTCAGVGSSELYTRFQPALTRSRACVFAVLTTVSSSSSVRSAVAVFARSHPVAVTAQRYRSQLLDWAENWCARLTWESTVMIVLIGNLAAIASYAHNEFVNNASDLPTYDPALTRLCPNNNCRYAVADQPITSCPSCWARLPGAVS